MDALFLAQAAAPTTGSAWMQVIQNTLSKVLGSGGLSGWVDAVLPAFQILGFVIVTASLSLKFSKSKDNPVEMVHVLLALILTLFLVGQPRYIFALANGAVKAIMPAQFQANWNPGGTFTPPQVVKDMSAQIKQAIVGPPGAASGAAGDATTQYHWYKLGVDRLLAGVKSLDPRLLLAQGTTALVEFFADTSLFILGVMYLVMALILEINLLVFPAMIALWHTEMFSGVSREFCKHCIAVLFWPLGWGIGLLSAEGVMGGMSNVDGTIAGIVSFALSLFLVCFWLVFAAIAGPVLIHKLITNGSSIGQGLMAGGIGGGGALAVGAAGLTAGLAIKGASAALGKGVSMLGNGAAKLLRGGGGGGESGGGGNRTSAADAGSRSSLARSLRGSRDSGETRTSGDGAGGVRAGGGGDGGGTGGNGEGSTGGGGETSQDRSGGMAARIRSAVASSIAGTSQALAQGISKGGGTIGGAVNNLAARGAVKLDNAGDAFAEVGGAPVSSIKANNHALRRRAEAPILPFPRPLTSGAGGGSGGGNQPQRHGGSSRGVPAQAGSNGGAGRGEEGSSSGEEAIDGEWEVVREDQPRGRGSRRRS